MYAVFVSGGKQHIAREGETLRLEKLEAEPGAEIAFDQVLLVSGEGGISIGEPQIEGARVVARVVQHSRDKKIRIVKMRRRKNSRTRTGHRQWYTEVQITGIEH